MAGKRKTATKLEVFYIQKNPDKKTVQELADELSLFRGTVEKIIEEAPREEVSIQLVESPPNTAPTKRANVMEEMGGIAFNKKKGQENKPGRVAIMMENGSMIIDSVGKANRNKAKNSNKTGIAKPYPDRE